MDSWERFDETLLPNIKGFHSSLNMEGVTSVDYRYEKRVFKNFNNENIGDYHDFYVKSDTLLLAVAFENFRNKCIEVYELDPTNVLSAPGLAWQACLKKTEIKLEILTDVDILLMVEEGIREQYVMQYMHKYARPNNKYMKNYNKNKDSSYIQYLDVNNLYGWAMSQKLPVNGFKWEKTLLSLMKTS